MFLESLDSRIWAGVAGIILKGKRGQASLWRVSFYYWHIWILLEGNDRLSVLSKEIT